MTGQADLSIYIQVTISFPLGLQLALEQKIYLHTTNFAIYNIGANNTSVAINCACYEKKSQCTLCILTNQISLSTVAQQNVFEQSEQSFTMLFPTQNNCYFTEITQLLYMILLTIIIIPLSFIMV